MFEGGLKLLAGLRLMLGNETLRAVLWRMIGLLAVLMLALLFGVFELAQYVAQLWLPEGDAWYWAVVSWLVWALAVVLSILTGVVSFTVLGSAAIAPWLDTLAVRTEVLHGQTSDKTQRGWLALCLLSLSNSVRPLLSLLAWGVTALLVIWIPVIGQVLATVIWGYASIHFLCFELMDTTASRQGWDFTQRKNTIQQSRFFWLGFGGLAMLMMMVPVLNLLVIPASVVALSMSKADINDIGTAV